jgi:vacuolar-type H+-ATPase subunit E/Vma4
MIRSLLKLGFMAVICIVIYNRFFGTDTEKDQSKRIFKGVGSVFTEVRTLVKSEREKFDAGKYDAALGKMQGVLENLRTHASDNKDVNLQNQIAQLEKRKAALENQVNATSQPSTDTGFQKAGDKIKHYTDMAKQMESLTNDLQNLVKQVAPNE